MEPEGSLSHSHNKVKILTWTGKLHRNILRKTKDNIIVTIRALSERDSKTAQENEAGPTEGNIFTTTVTVCFLRRVFICGKY
jgi:hypothetical protein